MSVPSYISERDTALYAAFQKALARPDVCSVQVAIRIAVNSPTEQFWISSGQCYRIIMNMKAGRKPNKKYSTAEDEQMRQLRQEMADELMRRYEKMERMPSYRGCSPFFITQFLVSQPAPKFYLSYSRALTIISRMRRERFAAKTAR